MSRPVAKASPSHQLLRVDGIPAPVEVRSHPTARRLTLRVSRTRRAVYLTVPQSFDVREANRFLARSLDWVIARLDGVPEAVPFQDGAVLPVRGVLHQVQFAGPGKGRRAVVTTIERPRKMPLLSVAGPVEHAPRRLKDWLQAQAKRDLDARVTHHTKSLGLRARKLTMRDQKSRWGSCSSDGHLSFSWRLVLAPPFVLDYVAAHEVAHLAEMNHGPRFWRLVAKTCPKSEEAKFWLRGNGMDLYRYGVEE
jgi:predicted metal-dependent hydrolase